MGAEISIVVYTSCYFVLITQDAPLQLYYVIEYNITGPDVPDYYEPTTSLLVDFTTPDFALRFNGTQPSRYYTKDAVPFIIGPFSISQLLKLALTFNDDANIPVFLLEGDPLTTPLCTTKYNGTCVVSGGKIVNNISGFCGDYEYCNGREYCALNGTCIHPGQTSCSPGSCCRDNISLGFGGYTTGRCYASNDCITSVPTQRPTTRTPTPVPTTLSTNSPTEISTNAPTSLPTTSEPTNQPTSQPVAVSTNAPTGMPTTTEPTGIPTNTMQPTTNTPTLQPTLVPTKQPTNGPTPEPTVLQTNSPTFAPAPLPTNNPTLAPILLSFPTTPPTALPTPRPTLMETESPVGDVTASQPANQGDGGVGESVVYGILLAASIAIFLMCIRFISSVRRARSII